MGCFLLVAENKHNNLPVFSEKKNEGGRYLKLSRNLKIWWEIPQVGRKMLPPMRIQKAFDQVSDPSPLSELQPVMNQPFRTAQAQVSESWEHGGHCPLATSS